jgi:hypothetical protein
MCITCPICQTALEDVAADFPSRPFCSKRCKLVDLSNWMNEVYRVPVDESAEPEPDATVH